MHAEPQTNMTRVGQPRSRTSQVFFGGLVMLVGLALLLDRAEMMEIGELWHYWPLLIVAMGVKRVLELGKDGPGVGGWMILAGTLLGLDKFAILDMRYTWPLFIVAFGVSLIFQSLRTRDRRVGDRS